RPNKGEPSRDATPTARERFPIVAGRATWTRSKAGVGPALLRAKRLLMNQKKIAMRPHKKIALVAHDHKKADLLQWAKFNRDLLSQHKVFATGTTGEILETELRFKITKLQSGPLGGDQQIGSKIVDDQIDFLIFF